MALLNFARHFRSIDKTVACVAYQHYCDIAEAIFFEELELRLEADPELVRLLALAVARYEVQHPDERTCLVDITEALYNDESRQFLNTGSK